MFFLVKLASGWLASWQADKLGFASATLLCIGLGATFYLGASFMMSSPELTQVVNGIKKKNR